MRQVDTLLLGVMCGTLLAGCNGLAGLTGSQDLPAGTQDPATFNTVAGARAMYNTALQSFQYSPPTGTGGGDGAFLAAVFSGGLLTDELQATDLGSAPVASPLAASIDARLLPEGPADDVAALTYQALHRVRGQAAQAIGQIAAFDTVDSPALRGHLYALQGYAEILLADLFCSGVPLTTLDFGKDFTYREGSTTAQLYRHAIALFDTAITLSADSARILSFAKVGKGRALLSLSLDSAQAAGRTVRDVPDDFQYQFPVNWLASVGTCGSARAAGYGTVANLEGGTGLPFRANGASDPRTAVQQVCVNNFRMPQYVAVKQGGATPRILSITVADGVEARLIMAEASLQSGDINGWLGILNRLRATMVTPALPELSDPGTIAARIDLHFQERAFWLFLTGHRQGDLRRLIRQYGRTQEHVYPTGAYPAGPGVPTRYGSDVTLPIPSSERINPLFAGCLNRGA